MFRSHYLTSVSTALLLAGLVACGSGTSTTASGSNQLALAFTTASTAPAGSVAGASDLVVSAGPNTLTITRAQVVLEKLELRGTAPSSCETESHDDNSHRECEELELDPMVIDLPVDASLVTSLVAQIPAGTYSSLEAKVRVVRSGDGGSAAFLAAHPELANASVRIGGSYNGTPFIFTGRPETSLELAFSPPLVVGASPTHVTVHVDLASWFSDGNGGLIDPSTAAPGAPNEQIVERNIARSFRAFEDEDRDGHDDHGHGGEGDGSVVR